MVNLNQLESTAKYFPAKLFAQTRQLIIAVPSCSVRLLLLEWVVAKIANDKRLAAEYKVAPAIPLEDADWKWLRDALVACRVRNAQTANDGLA